MTFPMSNSQTPTFFTNSEKRIHSCSKRTTFMITSLFKDDGYKSNNSVLSGLIFVKWTWLHSTICFMQCTTSFLPRRVYYGWGIVVTVLVCPYIRTYVRTYVRTHIGTYISTEFVLIFFLGGGIVMLVVLDEFFIFWKKWFFGPVTPFFGHFSDI